jgi:UDP-2,3-diacylglucosamine hydrolase
LIAALSAASAFTCDAVVAPANWRCIDFISDLHLAAITPATFAAWRDHLLNTPADAVLILGDLFEAWVGDDSRFDDFEASGAEALRDASRQRHIGFMVGNRDFLVGEQMLSDCGVTSLRDPTALRAFGQTALLTHGDAWCFADLDYQRFRRQVRDPAWQRQLLARPLVDRRALAQTLRSESERHAAARMGDWVDIDLAHALAAMEDAQASTLVHGHTHRPGTDVLAPGRVREVLSDWALEAGETHPRAQILRWQANGWTRVPPSSATAGHAAPC